MKVLITGANGFIGGNLEQYLRGYGHDIYKAVRINSVEIFDLKNVIIDWASLQSLNQAVKGVDLVIHAAGMDAKACELHPERALEFNGVATANLLNAAIENSVKKFVYLSTAHVYKSPLSGNISELTPVNNSHPYATSHKFGEDVVLQANKSKKIQGLVLRLSNIYGVPVSGKKSNSWDLFLNQICRQSIEEKKITLKSSGEQFRDFLSIRDFCEIVRKLIDIEDAVGLINVGSGTAMKLIDVAKLVQEKSNKLFSFKPEIYKITEKNYGIDDELNYRIDRLINFGIRPKSKIGEEIEQFLKDCARIFL